MWSLPVWGEWIEIGRRLVACGLRLSLPVWGEWIEMRWTPAVRDPAAVSPRVGRVD